ncbi:adenylate/guanylate cyclase domain-containing protein [Maribacter flavus]|uniref:Adenylate/guanylate cyclase domain-containing protein n=1 Tax=Maribacter flavus TaxID=1658664 RepID=A0A5B2TNF9_9FLAO|nr:adenylate/guanylate cyclase domain-containing protein [Maribacter flavus]KAA2215749.1 adenylate/guanylate cyclase domain-containing protein [Maribacter flavus]
MALEDTLALIDEEVKTMVDSNFAVNLSYTELVPSIDDSGLTFPSVSNNKIDTLELITCVLFIDVRKSTEISSSHHNKTLVKLYSAFVRSMVQAANYHGGKVRNIIGDRVMVVFDSKDCIKNAVNTAILLNSVSKYIINKHFRHNEIQCGIGIDYGKMQVVKTGSKKRGEENREYKALVWLGNTANIASKLTDVANKKIEYTEYVIEYMDNWHFLSGLMNPDSSKLSPFLGALTPLPSEPTKRKVSLSEKEFLRRISDSTLGVGFDLLGEIKSFKKNHKSIKTKSILITEEVYKLLSKNYPEMQCVKEGHWKVQSHIDKSFYSGVVYGADTFYIAAQKL